MRRDNYLTMVLNGDLQLAPMTKHLGWRILEYDAANATLKVCMETRPEFLNPFGFVHGGVLAAMLDETMAPTMAGTLGAGEFAPTLEMKVNFVSAAKAGSFFGTGRVIAKKKSIGFVEAKLEDENAVLIATASATFKISRHP